MRPIDPVLHIGRHVAGRMFLRDGHPKCLSLVVGERLARKGVLKITVPQDRKSPCALQQWKKLKSRNVACC